MVHTSNNIELNAKLEKFIRTGLLQFGLFLLAPFEVQFTKEERMKLEEKNKDKSVFALVKEDFMRLSVLEDKYEFYKSKGVRLFIKEVKADYNERLSTVVVELTLIAVIKEQKEVIEMVSAMTQNRLYDSFILDFFEEELNKGLAELEKKEKWLFHEWSR